ncbi:MAG: type IV secretion system protein VirB10 [Steroidobacteraceae bacterium]
MKRGTVKPDRSSAADGGAGATEDSVRGERGQPFVSTARSLQSRVSSIMACGLMLILGAGMLTWYYTNALSRQSRSKRSAQTAISHRAQGEMPLPGFTSLKAVSGTQALFAEPDRSDSITAESARPSTAEPPQLPLMVSQSNWAAGGRGGAKYTYPTRKSAGQLEKERLLSGAVFARESVGRSAVSGAAAVIADGSDRSNASGFGAANSQTAAANWPDGDIGPLLRPTVTASARARVLPTRRFLLAKGAFIDCTLETAIDSTLPGMTTCITATDTFSSDGSVVLLERGTKLIGETRGQVQQGIARVFVLWTEARTPTGIVVPLDSPGTDELGRSGLAGEVNRHFWDRFGAAILISTLDGAVQAAVQSASRAGGPVIYNPSSTTSVVTDVLKSTVNIPPTIAKPNGDRIQVLVARDLDFRSVYELRSVATAR